ncbi:UNVERIFIED_CONTAM: hypothetical protein GTU68_052662 [Idotea baltica]|nr:hypothetical protein [Idotea baltica]
MSTEVVPNPLPDSSVGIVETQSRTLFVESPLQLASGESLSPVDVAYETYGTLSEKCDNAIFICHALTGNKKPGWWDGLIGPGKTVDTDKYFVICANVLGGCQGTTGPGSLNPTTGKSYGLDFPFLTVADIVDVHSELVRSFGIEKLVAVIGGSLGGMQVLQWVAKQSQQVASAIVLASAPNLSAQGIAFNAVGRRAIYADPLFKDGLYDDENPPRFGLALARMIAHITYLSEDSIELKFGRRLQDKTEFQIESYLHHQGKRFVQRFDANSYLYLTRAMDYFTLGSNRDELAATFADSTTRFLVASYTTDWLFPSVQSRELVTALLQAKQHVTYEELESPYGHDSFLLEMESLDRLVRPFLKQTQKSFQGAS